MVSTKASIVVLLALVVGTVGFYLPGVAPHDYAEGEVLPVKVNSIKSVNTAIPYDFYSLMVCRPDTPKGKIHSEAENIGELLWGDSIKPSRYLLQVQREVTCTKLCTTKPKSDNVEKRTGISKPLRKLKRRIDDGYRGHMIADNLPVSEVYIWAGSERGLYYRRGYPLGIPGNKTNPTLVHNHLALTVRVHRHEGGWRVVGFEVVPYSVRSDKIDSECGSNPDFDPEKFPPQELTITPPTQAPKSISWSYSVHWLEDRDVAWSSRWDHYLRSSDASAANIHWFAIANSLMVVLCLTAMVGMILLRALHKDFNRYNNPENEEEAQEETGWKVVHGDVFRAPPFHVALSVFVGTGSQLMGMGCLTLLFALVGFLSPARRGALMTAMVLVFALMGSAGGYVTAVLAKMFGQPSWRTVTATGLTFPGTVFLVFFMLNLMLWGLQASSAVPFLLLLGLFALWLFVSLPLVLCGGIIGYRQSALKFPRQVNSIPRPIPQQKFHLRPATILLCSGAVPFGAAFIELYFILSSLWLNKFYYVFGFFAIVFLILTITCAEISIVLVYFQLCYEDHRWWWPAFLYPGTSGLYLFIYSVYYLASSLTIHKFWSIVLYLSYMGLVSYGLFILTGTIGFLASLVFVRHIYAALKVD
jgi:transmembrane 9 superfamily member 2/4